MSTNFGYSSELYLIEPQDIINLADASSDLASGIKCDDEIIVLLGDAKTQTPDVLVKGRKMAKNALEKQKAYVPVRFAFKSNIATWNILPIFFKQLRQYFKFTNANVYHTSLKHLRELHIERGFRNAENAYDISKRWHISPEERVRKYTELKESLLSQGFDDKKPISIMLCRRCGIKDSVDDGHHRIGICVENDIDRIAIQFKAAGALPRFLQKIGLKILPRQN